MCHGVTLLYKRCGKSMYLVLRCHAVEIVPRLGADRNVGRNRHYAKIEAMGAMLVAVSGICCSVGVSCISLVLAPLISSKFQNN